MLSYSNMKTTWKVLMLAAMTLAVPSSGWAKSDRETGQFNQVLQLIRTNLPGIDAEAMEKEAVRRLLRGIGEDVELVRKRDRNARFEGTLMEPIKSYEDSYGYVRVRNVEAGLAEALHQGLNEMKPEAAGGGLMVDLRFAIGSDYAAAVWAANQFVSRDETQLLVGDRHLSLMQNSNLITGRPIAVLVNAETTGAAEALATLLRKHEVGLVIGSNTSGRTKVFSSFDLSDGARLRIATGDVKFGDGAPLPPQGLEPDIEVDVKLDDERMFFGDAYANPRKGKRKQQVNEADLVRQLALKLNPNAKLEPRPAVDPVNKEVFDPVLARALDLLKGLDTLKRAK